MWYNTYKINCNSDILQKPPHVWCGGFFMPEYAFQYSYYHLADDKMAAVLIHDFAVG